MRIIIDAQFVSGGMHGGIEQVVMNLVRALGELDKESEYIIFSHWRSPNWLKSFISPNQRIVTRLDHPQDDRARLIPSKVRVPVAQFLKYARRWIAPQTAPMAVPNSEGFYESFSADLVHFPFQGFVRSRLASVYCPYDLQHLHYPQFFQTDQASLRDQVYRAGCIESTAIAVPSQWVKRDIVQQYGVNPEKIYVTHLAAATEVAPLVTDEAKHRVAGKYHLPQIFAFFPAQTWQHKNHLRLVEAIALLRDRDRLVLNIVCSGKQNEFFAVIKRRVHELQLDAQVRFLGFVAPAELLALYHLAQFVIHPSLFEGGGMPVLEAFRAGTPVACSNVTSLPEYAGDAALYFDPTSPESIADAARRMMRDDGLRADLCARGTVRVRLFTWERTAKIYRALYRKVAGQSLSNEDAHLLNSST